MSRIQFIKEFLFDYAQYQLRDTFGHDVVLQINYKSNNFVIKTEEKLDKAFLKEINTVAKKLLKKKHGVNRVSFL